MSKEQLRTWLERQARRFIALEGGEVLLYAAHPKPDKRPWCKTSGLPDDAFQAEVRKIESRHDVDA